MNEARRIEEQLLMLKEWYDKFYDVMKHPYSTEEFEKWTMELRGQLETFHINSGKLNEVLAIQHEQQKKFQDFLLKVQNELNENNQN
jgi:hypothetical protein